MTYWTELEFRGSHELGVDSKPRNSKKLPEFRLCKNYLLSSKQWKGLVTMLFLWQYACLATCSTRHWQCNVATLYFWWHSYLAVVLKAQCFFFYCFLFFVARQTHSRMHFFWTSISCFWNFLSTSTRSFKFVKFLDRTRDLFTRWKSWERWEF